MTLVIRAQQKYFTLTVGRAKMGSRLLQFGLVLLTMSCVPEVRPAAPPEMGQLPPIEQLPESNVSVPIEFDIGKAITTVDSQVPHSFSYFPTTGYDCHGRNDPPPGDDHCWQDLGHNPDIQIRYISDRTPLGGQANGSQLSVNTDVSYAIRARVRIGSLIPWENASCGCNQERWCNNDPGDRRIVTVGFSSPVGISDSWRLNSNFANGIQIIARNDCTLKFGVLAGFQAVTATSQITGQVRNALGPSAASLDAQIAAFDGIQTGAAKIWDLLQTPVAADIGGTSALLRLRPTALAVSPMSGNGSRAVFTVQVRAHPIVEVAGSLEKTSKTPLPNAAPYDPSLAGVFISLPVTARLDDLGKPLRSVFVGGKRRYPPPPEQGVNIDNIDMYGNGSQLVLHVAVSGDFNGDLYLQGRLSYDGARREIFVTNLGYTVNTKNILFRIAAWWKSEGLLQALASAARWPMGPAIDSAKESLNKAITHEIAPGVSMTGAIDHLDLVQVASDSSELRLVFTAHGRLALDAIKASLP